MRPFKRIGTASPAAGLVSCVLLAALLIQVLPFAFSTALPAVDLPGDGVTRYFEPLPVCGDTQAAGGFLADVPWISPSPPGMIFASEGATFAASSMPAVREGFASPVYRPPRPFFPLT